MHNHSDNPQPNVLSFDKLHIIQWLGSTDRKTGKELFNTLQASGDIDHNLVEFVDIADKSELLSVLDNLIISCRDKDSIPLIHIETHGNDSGIGTSVNPNQFIEHTDLLEVLRELNVQTKFNLFIVMAACFGSKLVKIIKDTLLKPSPFWGVMGPIKETYDDYIYRGYCAFYKSFFKTYNINESMKVMKDEVPQFDKDLRMYTAEELFQKAIKQYCTDKCSLEISLKRAEAIIETFNVTSKDKITDLDFKYKIAEYLQSTVSKKAIFDARKRVFFMHDLYADNPELSDPEFPLDI
ncbi:MAG: hypothetical protein PHO32_04870 [Candidatus Cloacimonetes bacterium]|nr:hypothetical protein [Candidatus Cloacimonadota bacterium]